MLHRADQADDKDIAEVRFSGEMNYMFVCPSGQIGFYTLRLLYKDSEHEKQENRDMQEALELGKNCFSAAGEPLGQWG